MTSPFTSDFGTAAHERSHRHFGKFRGIVTNVDDPLGIARIQARVPDVLGSEETGWALPALPYAGDNMGQHTIPPVGAGVWIEFEAGDVSYPIWVGCYWRAGEKPSDAAPKVKAIVTAAKHKILVNDDDGSITIEDNNQNKITMTSDGITLERGSNKVVVSDSNVSVNDGSLEVI